MSPKNNKVIKDLFEFKNICSEYQQANRKVVFTNGCFDIIHAGHVHLLNEAKKFGDILIVAVNSDSSIKKFKSQSRPINNTEDRVLVLSAMTVIDHIFIFDEETPENIINEIIPDVLVKGNDYEGKFIAGEKCMKENKKEVKLIKLLEGKSTTATINNIKTIDD
tara:strand:+ start:1554 stop:2045 length:492 start_codon:yes stop_codon:yes gene_type:complete